MGIKVSVILPSLNVVNYIEEAVRSAMRQTLKEIEILCIDACSDDGTWEMLAELAKTDERIKLCRSDVKSYGYQVNMGIDMAQGEYVAVLETDDYADKQMYERLYNEAVLYDCDYVKSDYTIYRTQNDGKRIFLRRALFQTQELYGKIIEPVKYSAVAVGDWYLWNGIYKKKFLIKNHIRLAETPGAAYQDIGFVYQTNIYAKRAVFLQESCYRYCTDRDGASANSGKGLQYAYQEYQRLYQWLQTKEPDGEKIREFYCRMAKSFIYCCEGLEDGKIKIGEQERNTYYAWFQQRLKEALEQNLVDREVFYPEAWRKLEVLLVSEAYYIEICKAHKKRITDILGKPGEYPIIIFGGGHYGCQACTWLTEQAYYVVSFIDNNKALWGTKVNDIIVNSPERAKAEFDRAKYLIANEKHSAQMKEQLLNMDIAEADISLYIGIEKTV